MYLGINFVSFHNVSIRFWKCPDSVVFFIFPFIVEMHFL